MHLAHPVVLPSMDISNNKFFDSSITMLDKSHNKS